MPQSKSRPRPKFIPASAELVQRFEKALQSTPEAEPRKMFGYPAAFVNGQLFAGLFGETMMLRLGADDRARIGKKGAKPFEPMPGRIMTEYVVVPESILGSPRQLGVWLGKALTYAQSLPPKSSKPRRPRTVKT